MDETTLSSFDGTELFLNREISNTDKAIVVIVHGLCEHQGRYDYFAQKLHDAAIGTYRFDHRGHGRSEGEETYYSDFNQLLDDTNEVVNLAIEDNPKLPVFLLGHSMGGFTVSLYGSKYPNTHLRGIITSGALVRDHQGLITGVPKGLDPHMRLPNELGNGVCSVAEIVDWYGKDPYNKKSFTPGLCYSICDGIFWFKEHIKAFSYPVFMTHGECDGLVNVKDTYDFFSGVSSADKQMKIYGGLFHEILNEYCRDEVMADIISWIQHRI